MFKKEFHLEYMPALPESILPMTTASQTVVMQLAKLFRATKQFIFTEVISLPDHQIVIWSLELFFFVQKLGS